MMFVMKSLSLAAGLALLALAGGCASSPPGKSGRGPSMPDPGADKEYQVNFPDPGHGMARYIRMTIDQDLSKSCGLMRTYFAFDSSKLTAEDQAALRDVAACLARPELKGSQLSIVGRADARGNTGYNAALGLRRAESVKKLLIGAGVAENRIGIASLGATDTVGTDDDNDLYSYSHGYDRRVDVVLVGVPRTPL
jgi:outer membrane protein OmpA-like peptidoglycan-associated protein